MYHSGYPRQATVGPARVELALRVTLVLTIMVQLTLLLIALVPQSVWAAHNLPDGPIPRQFYAVVAGLFYLLPAVTGALCRKWPLAVVLATLPAWLDLGIFAVAAAGRIGPFYLSQQDHAINTVGTLELFAALGALGWLARTAMLDVWTRRAWRRP
jgi:hypothetical protein